VSRDPDRWQRTILDALDREPSCYLRDLLPPDATPVDHRALYRAAVALHEAGQVRLRVALGGAKSVYVARPDEEPPIDHPTPGRSRRGSSVTSDMTIIRPVVRRS
jgi:hypothetical protein